MHYQKRFVLFCLIWVLIFPTAGCRPVGENNSIDRDAFQALEKYIYQIVPAVEGAKYDIDQWVQDISDPQMLGWLECDAEVIAEINDRHLIDDFPDFTTIESWNAVPVTRGDREWTIDGRELASLVEKITSSTMTLASQLQDISRAGERVTEKESHDLGAVVEEAYQTALELRYLFGFEE